jgi:hypothetical protein
MSDDGGAKKHIRIDPVPIVIGVDIYKKSTIAQLVGTVAHFVYNVHS